MLRPQDRRLSEEEGVREPERGLGAGGGPVKLSGAGEWQENSRRRKVTSIRPSFAPVRPLLTAVLPAVTPRGRVGLPGQRLALPAADLQPVRQPSGEPTEREGQGAGPRSGARARPASGQLLRLIYFVISISPLFTGKYG